MCRRCRRREIKVELEVWHQYRRGEEESEEVTSRSTTPRSTSVKSLSGGGSSSSGASAPGDNRGGGGGGAVSDPGTSKPDDLYGECPHMLETARKLEAAGAWLGLPAGWPACKGGGGQSPAHLNPWSKHANKEPVFQAMLLPRTARELLTVYSQERQLVPSV